MCVSSISEQARAPTRELLLPAPALARAATPTPRPGAPAGAGLRPAPRTPSLPGSSPPPGRPRAAHAAHRQAQGAQEQAARGCRLHPARTRGETHDVRSQALRLPENGQNSWSPRLTGWRPSAPSRLGPQPAVRRRPRPPSPPSRVGPEQADPSPGSRLTCVPQQRTRPCQGCTATPEATSQWAQPSSQELRLSASG